MTWFYNLKTVSKLIFGFSLACTLTAVVGYLGVTNMQRINDMMTVMYERDLVGLSSTKQAWITLVQVGREARKVVLTETPEDTEKSAAAIAKGFDTLKRQLDEAAATLITEEGQANIAVVTDTLPEYQSAISDIVSNKRAGREQEARDGLKLLPGIGDKMEAAMETVAGSKETLAVESNSEADQIYASSSSLMIGAIVIAVVFGLGLGYFIARVISKPLIEAAAVLQKVAAGDLTQSLDLQTRDEVGQLAASLNEAVGSMRSALDEVRDSSGSLTSSSAQLASASEQLSEGAQEQAASLEETAASLEQITTTVKQNAENATQANQLAVSSRDAAESGGEVVSATVTAMNEINVASKKIADIIVAIDEIAFQTNILALNAAVEAARAGEQGRGFAVVASEVRSLAQRSATAAKEIKALIQDSVRKVDNGSELVDKSGETLREIIASVKRVTDIVSEIAAASREQSTGIEQVNKAMSQMDEVTQANAAQTEELSSTAQSMAGHADQLQVMVSRFQLGGDSGRSSTGFQAPERKIQSKANRRTSDSSTLLVGPGAVRPPSGDGSLSKLAQNVGTSSKPSQEVSEGAFEEF